jgi:hypothetical protein
VPNVTWPSTAVPVLYLPGVSRATLRATEECPNELKPLAELQYRGVFWSHPNGKDWTIAAFLQSENGGLKLKVSRDAGTSTSIRRSIEKLVDIPLAELRAKSDSGELNSVFFDSLISDSLISDDPVDDLLSWLADPKGTRDRWEPGRWETLCSRCETSYGFSPERDGHLVGAEALGLQEKAVWRSAWKRFAAAPGRYLGLVELSRKAKPQPRAGDLLATVRSEPWPQDNEANELDLRMALLQVASEPLAKGRERLLALEKEHAPRRDWVWAKLNRSPMAQAVAHLATLAEATSKPLAGGTMADLINAYTKEGWRADLAVLESLAILTRAQDRDSVSSAIAHV